jgi:hypothetical protein
MPENTKQFEVIGEECYFYHIDQMKMKGTQQLRAAYVILH